MPRKKVPSRPTFQVNLTADELAKLKFIANSKGEFMTDIFKSFIGKTYRELKKQEKKNG